MLYVDYNFDLNDNIIILDPDMHFAGRPSVTGNRGGELPAGWKECDMWQMITGVNGQVTLIKVKNETT